MIAYAGASQLSSLGVFSSTNGGKTWSNISLAITPSTSDFYDLPFLTVE